MSENHTPNLNKALSQLQGKLPRVTKGNEGKVSGEKDGRSYSYSYKYADLADVTAAVGPLLAEFGLAFHAAPTIDPANRQEMILVWSLLHESGEERSGEYPLGAARQKPQSLGSMITYARRYCLGAATGIVAEEDDDGQRAQHDRGRQSAGDVFDGATPSRPRQDRPVNQGPRSVEAEAIDHDAQALADEAHRATDPVAIEDIHKRAREAGKLAGNIRNPASGGIGQLALYLNWRKKQLASAAQAAAPSDAFEQALARLGDSPWVDSIRDIPDGDVDQARRLLDDADKVDMDAAKRLLVRDAILTRVPQAGRTEAAAA